MKDEQDLEPGLWRRDPGFSLSPEGRGTPEFALAIATQVEGIRPRVRDYC